MLKGLLKTIILKLPFGRPIADAIKRQLPSYKTSIPYWIKKYIHNAEVNVVQIGAFDGATEDHLFDLIRRNNKWNVLFVEPVPESFKALKQNYGNASRFSFENAGINKTGESQPFYKISDKAFLDIDDLSISYRQISSFSLAHVKALSKDVIPENYIHSIDINCLSLNDLFKKHKIDALDLFVIDAEGYDWEIVSQLDLNLYQPKVIIFEAVNLNQDELSEAKNNLGKLYFIFKMGINYVCFRKDIVKQNDYNHLNKLKAISFNNDH
ncbi:MAG: FkbM family methyltransferase [Winogradskyella sp.]|uniref:FkbM family methyltransferase n=1 Tax=Winogradskyella sp. TaxID=1883156 RepID=UPI0025F70B18|nr:FkbM family methyltransferase [Winogradskyella sp.]NRB60199.1 FkbM family methyltransferase [Winogradskyella sp.]